MSNQSSPDRADNRGVSRRTFLQSSAAAAAMTVIPGWMGSTAYAQSGGTVLKLATVGCGGRGKGAMANAIEAAGQLGIQAKVVAVCDYFADRTNEAGDKFEVPPEMRFTGPLGYQELMQVDADVVILATPPIFRPVHLAAAVAAGRHVFLEKPVAVDPVGCRQVMAIADEAKAKGLNIIAGTQRRHEIKYLQFAKAVEQGAIGTIVSGQIYWCQSRLWYKTREENDSNNDYLVRNWVSFLEMSGDHIVEQHVHQIDLANWFLGRPPVSAVGMGSRARRVTGNMYDQFSVEFDYGEGCTIASMSRQISGCWNRVDAQFVGTEGRVWDNRRIARYDKAEIELPQIDSGDKPYVQEHVDLQKAILNGPTVNEAQQVAESTMAGLMGRIAAYTGQQVTWDDLVNKQDSPWYNLALSPAARDFEAGDVPIPQEDIVPLPGE
ncbi:MAG: Gfo/Idh/MocA family oxidoreductase [Phycisphaeraceae bacterium]|nr:Gfo/Idh/MocA family oxidoreductase [Phycisphaeraceae bacterium]